MDFLENKMNDKPVSNWYIQVLEWLVEHAVVWTTLILGWKAIDMGFKYLKDRRLAEELLEREAREAKIRQIVQDEMNKGVLMRLDNISDKVDDLSNAFFKANIKK